VHTFALKYRPATDDEFERTHFFVYLPAERMNEAVGIAANLELKLDGATLRAVWWVGGRPGLDLRSFSGRPVRRSRPLRRQGGGTTS
jgi:hypothetical protein